ncbi:MAG TPA: hypothetical protein VIM39_07365, partial [Candidatus Limnocylindrales bacterium]
AAHVPPGCRFNPRCPYAFDRCRVEEPPLFDVGGGQSAACWLAEGGRALPVLPPRIPEPITTTGAVAAGRADAPAASAGAVATEPA